MGLAEQHCEPCEGLSEAISQADARARLLTIDSWDLSDDATSISRRWQFKNYALALEFVKKASIIAEAEGHHPDITFGWGYAKVELTTHAINGLSENDFIIAAKLNDISEQT